MSGEQRKKWGKRELWDILEVSLFPIGKYKQLLIRIYANTSGKARKIKSEK
jgi:hypothetical protein